MTDHSTPTTGDHVGTGRTADVVALDRTRVVKWFRPSVSEAAIRREATNASVAADLGIPTPDVHGEVERDGRRGIVFERIAGPTLAAALLAHPWRVVGSARRFADLHRRIHAVAPGDQTTRGSDRAVASGDHESDVPPLKPRLRERIETVDLPRSTRRRALDVLDALPDGDVLCHGDFHPENVLVDDGRPTIIDWLDAATGHPAADVARTSLLLRLARPSDESSIVEATTFRVVVDVLRWCYGRQYARRAPFDRRLIEAWELPVAVARWNEALPSERSALERRIDALLDSVRVAEVRSLSSPRKRRSN